MENEMIG